MDESQKDTAILVTILVVAFLLYLIFVWWSSGVMCKNLGFKSRSNCILVGIFLAPLYIPLFFVSFIFALYNNNVNFEQETFPKKKVSGKKVSGKKVSGKNKK